MGTFARAAVTSSAAFYIDESNILWSFGDNAFGQLGNGGKSGTKKPSRALGNVVKVVATETCTFALKGDYTIWIAGYHPAFRGEDYEPADHLEFENLTHDVITTGVVNILESDGMLTIKLLDGTLWETDNRYGFVRNAICELKEHMSDFT